MVVAQPVRREVHFWTEEIREPPCGTLEDRVEWSDAVEDVTCEQCLEALAGDSGDLAVPDDERGTLDDHLVP
jgi:hypothetical protein